MVTIVHNIKNHAFTCQHYRCTVLRKTGYNLDPFLYFCCLTEWLSWTEAAFLRWTLRPTSSHNGGSSTECAEKLGWSRPVLDLVAWSWQPEMQMQLCLALHHLLNRAIRQFLAAQNTFPQGHCWWISRAAVDAAPTSISCFFNMPKIAVPRQRLC